MHLSNRNIIKNSLPIAFAYIILGFTFGALFSSKGGTPLEALVISLFCFAGAAQFVALEFYKPDFPVVFMFVTIFTLNIRHVFYGMSYINTWKGIKKIYLLMSLTDENFGISNYYRSFKPSDNEWIKIYSINHGYWVFGCIAGSLIPLELFNRVLGAEYSLIALFIAIFASSMKRRKKLAYAYN
jgi:4-azaleucine resistance transporter AzlC